LQKKALGSFLYEQVFYALDIIEKDYFGLQFMDANHVKHWLDPTKPIKKQVKSELMCETNYVGQTILIILPFPQLGRPTRSG